MSDQAIFLWGALATLAGVITSIIVTELSHFLVRRERFRDITFEKRLAAHQQAFCRNQDLYEALNSNTTDTTDAISIRANEMKEWWKNNCFYLDNNSSKSMLNLINSTLAYNLAQTSQQGKDRTWTLLDKNLKDIVNGIGMKYLPRVKTEITSPSDAVVDKKRINIWRLILAIVFCLAFIAFFALSEKSSGIFRWWHIYVLIGTLLIAVLTRVIHQLGDLLRNIMENFKFDNKAPEVATGVRREFFMAQVPVCFFISIYLAQNGLTGGNINITSIILSIIVFSFVLNLIVASFLRKPNEIYARYTHKFASWLSLGGVAVFIIDLLKTTTDLNKTGINNFYTYMFLGFGILVMLAMLVFFLISVSYQDN